MISIISYNVNGIRAAIKKGLIEWVYSESPDILCLQEIKVDDSLVGEIMESFKGYYSIPNCAAKKGYSGTVILSKISPINQWVEMGIEEYDREGRIVVAEYRSFFVVNAYFPSGTSGSERQKIKERFLFDFTNFILTIKEKGKGVIIVGDFNIAHMDIDLHDPKRNRNTPGFLPIEKQWLTSLLEQGFVDSFRAMNKEIDQYTWWSYRSNARERNKGWRIDYQLVSKSMNDSIIDHRILSDVKFSDHAPIKMTFKG